jgi:hypothetical protein
MATLTAANSVIILTIPGPFPNPQQLQGFDVDDVFSSEAVSPAQTKMGVDGFLSGGWVATEKKVTYTLQADSPSNAVFDGWYAFNEQLREVSIAQGSIIYPAISQVFTLIRGFLTTYTPIADAKQLIQPRKFTVTWQRIVGVPI